MKQRTAKARRSSRGPDIVKHPQAPAAYAAFQEATLTLFNVLLQDRMQAGDRAQMDGAPAYAMVDILCEVIKMFGAMAANMPIDPKKAEDREFMRHFLDMNVDLAKKHAIPAAIEEWIADADADGAN